VEEELGQTTFFSTNGHVSPSICRECGGDRVYFLAASFVRVSPLGINLVYEFNL
jgi:hypothetical protein